MVDKDQKKKKKSLLLRTLFPELWAIKILILKIDKAREILSIQPKPKIHWYNLQSWLTRAKSTQIHKSSQLGQDLSFYHSFAFCEPSPRMKRKTNKKGKLWNGGLKHWALIIDETSVPILYAMCNIYSHSWKNQISAELKHNQTHVLFPVKRIYHQLWQISWIQQIGKRFFLLESNFCGHQPANYLEFEWISWSLSENSRY